LEWYITRSWPLCTQDFSKDFSALDKNEQNLISKSAQAQDT
jgi:hypothetical protein